MEYYDEDAWGFFVDIEKPYIPVKKNNNNVNNYKMNSNLHLTLISTIITYLCSIFNFKIYQTKDI